MEAKSKYRSKITEYNGVKFHSKKEAEYAKKLDWLIKVGTVTRWVGQCSYALGINEVLICRYILDFKVWYSDGRIEHIDVKGMKSGSAYSMFKLKKKLMKAILNIDVIEV